MIKCPAVRPLVVKPGRYHLPGKGVALAIVGACLFSTKPVIVKLAYGYSIDATTLMTLRMAFSLPFYLVFALLAFRQRKARGIRTDYSFNTLARVFLLGIIGYYLASYLALVGLTMITAQFERLILFTYPGFVILIGALILGQKPPAHFLSTLAVTYLGLLLVFGQDLHQFGDAVWLGAFSVLVSAICFSCYILFSQFGIAKIGSRLFTCLAMIAASIAILVHFSLTHSLAMLVQPFEVYGLILLIALFATVIPSFLIAAAIEEIGSGPTAILSSIGPVFTTVLSVFLLGEPFTVWHFAGMSLVISGTVMLSLKKSAHN